MLAWTFSDSRVATFCHGRTRYGPAGTIFSNRKLDFTDLLAAIVLFVNGAKGVSALQISRDLDVQYKSAFVLMHKLRASLLVHRDQTPLAGTVQVDGCYTGGSVKPANRAEERVDRRLAENRNPDRRCIQVMRETFPEHAAQGLFIVFFKMD